MTYFYGEKHITTIIIAAITIVSLLLIGCDQWVIEETPTPDLSTATPSATPTDPPTPTPPTPTITPTTLYTATPLLGASNTPAGPAGNPTASVPPPEIEYFVSFPEEPEEDEPVVLFWDSFGGETATVTRLNPDGSDGRSWEVDVAGSLDVFPRLIGRDEVYVLAVTNEAATTEKSLMIRLPCQVAWFFTPTPKEGCPDPEVFIAEAMVQDFQHGRMFYLSATNEILVLFNDVVLGEVELEEGQTIDDLPPAWIIVDNPFAEGDPESNPDLVPPDGLLQPTLGFGKLWRNNPRIQERLGWAKSLETFYFMTYQIEYLPDEDLLYFTDAANAVHLLEPGQRGWRVIGIIDQ